MTLSTADLQATQAGPNHASVEKGHDSDVRTQFVTMSVAGQEYAVDIIAVKEIQGWTETTSLPNTPPYIRGVINLRGVVVPILDLRARFGLGQTEATKSHVIIIVHVEDRLLGVLVDAVSDILNVRAEEIRTVPTTSKDDENAFLSGLVSLENQMVAILILEKIFDHNIELNYDKSLFDSVHEESEQLKADLADETTLN